MSRQRDLQRKVQRGLLAPYRAIAEKTDDREAAAAIEGLIHMVETAMTRFGAFKVPKDSPNFALLVALADAENVEEMQEIAQRARNGEFR
jgi:hypothetical protein